MEDLFKGLNERQIEAVKATEGYYRVIAGAGSGKTRTLTHRFAYIVTELGISARNILCVTFTNKAANEMKARIRRLLGDGYENALIATYHGFCVKVLKEDIYKLFFPANFKILDTGGQKKILEEIYAEYEIKLDYNSFEKTLEYIYKEKTHLEYIPKMCDPAYIFDPEKGLSLEEKIYLKYLAHQKKIYGLDFNDLIYFTIYLFEHHEDILAKWQDRLHYIQVDEFQDSSKKELDIINALCKKHNNLFVVGDPDQNIYEWRYSENRFLVHFDKNYPDVTTIILNQNYRSTPEILSVSNSLIEKNQNRVPKDLFTLNESGKRVEHIHLKSETDESKWIVSKIREIVEEKKKLYSDIAVLFRSSHVSRFIEQSLYSENIPYLIHGGVRFFDRMEIRDSIAFLKLAAGNDDEALLRIINVPKRQIGKSRIDYLKQTQREFRDNYAIEKSLFEILRDNAGEPIFFNTKAEDFINIITEHREKAKNTNIKISDLLNSLLERTRYKEYISRSGDMERFDNVTELLASITEFEQQAGEDVSLEAYLQQLSVISDYESERSKNCVKLMTIHASKGLEFPYVIIAGMTEGVFPSRRTIDERKENGLEEERRLCYVAMTRAMRELYMIESEGKTYGEMRKLPSRFLFDIDAAHIDMTGVIPEEILKDLTAKINQTNQANKINQVSPANLVNSTDSDRKFKIGNKVNHRFFGQGEIISIDLKGDAYIIDFANIGSSKPININYEGLTLIDGGSERGNINNEPLTGEIISDIPVSTPQRSTRSNFNKKMDRYFDNKKMQTINPLQPPKQIKKPKRNDEIGEQQIELFIAEIEKELDMAEKLEDIVSSNVSDISDILETAEIINIDDLDDKDDELPEFAGGGDIFDIVEVKAEKEDYINQESAETHNIINEEAESEEGGGVDLIPPNMPRSLYEASPQILHDNSDRVNLWNDPEIPKKGWICIDVIDLGYPSGQCGMCGKEEIRYVHIMQHENELTIGAGCICAGKMEGNIELAKERENTLKNRINRFRTFFKTELKTSSKGNLYTKYRETLITFLRDKNNTNGWKFVEGGEYSNLFDSLEEAKIAAFMKIDARR